VLRVEPACVPKIDERAVMLRLVFAVTSDNDRDRHAYLKGVVLEGINLKRFGIHLPPTAKRAYDSDDENKHQADTREGEGHSSIKRVHCFAGLVTVQIVSRQVSL